MFNEAHTGNNLAVLLQNVCREWNINIKDTALVTDNAKNMMLAGVGAEMDPHVRCIAHTLNLASQKSLKVDRVSELLTKVRKVVTFFIEAQKQLKFCVKCRPSYTCQTTSLSTMFPQDGTVHLTCWSVFGSNSLLC